MKVFWWILIFCLYEKSISVNVFKLWPELVMYELQNTKPHHITLFINSTNNINIENRKLQDFFINTFIGRVSIILIDLIKMKKSIDKRTIRMPLFQNP